MTNEEIITKIEYVECRCSEAYKSRDMVDESCPRCNSIDDTLKAMDEARNDERKKMEEKIKNVRSQRNDVEQQLMQIKHRYGKLIDSANKKIKANSDRPMSEDYINAVASKEAAEYVVYNFNKKSKKLFKQQK